MKETGNQRNTKVRSHFEESSYYLSDNHNIEYRKKIIKALLGNGLFSSIIDVACGNAEISLGLFNGTGKLTLLDISNNMLKEAARNIPDGFRSHVRLVQGDFLETELPTKAFDLVVCTGLLAHISDPGAALEKMASLLTPGGTIILQNTNASHPYSHLLYAYRALGAMMDKRKYNFNRVKESAVIEILSKHNIHLTARLRYIQSFMLLDKFIPRNIKYRLLAQVFGVRRERPLSFLGNECIYCFQHDEP